MICLARLRRFRAAVRAKSAPNLMPGLGLRRRGWGLNTIMAEVRHYANTISKGSAPLEETRTLPRALQPSESRNEFCEPRVRYPQFSAH